MTETMPKYEEAKHCPKCGLIGVLSATNTVNNSVRVETYKCDNILCPWYRTGWIVQINADGSIPDRKAGPKQFTPMTPRMETFARDNLRSIQLEEESNQSQPNERGQSG